MVSSAGRVVIPLCAGGLLVLRGAGRLLIPLVGPAKGGGVAGRICPRATGLVKGWGFVLLGAEWCLLSCCPERRLILLGTERLLTGPRRRRTEVVGPDIERRRLRQATAA